MLLCPGGEKGMSDVITKLQQLNKSDEYPLHMPGHKRNYQAGGLADLDGIGSFTIQDLVFVDGNTEWQFAENLEAATEVVVYAKLPRSFQIPTPVGNYAPDWAIAFDKDKVKHVFFIAETKGSLDDMQLLCTFNFV